MINGVLNGLAYQTLRAFFRHRLNTNAAVFGEANLGNTHFLFEELNDLNSLWAVRLPFNAGVNVFRVFTEDNHVGELWV